MQTKITNDDYKKYPNLMRVAKELAACKNAYKVAPTLLFIIERSIQNSANGTDNLRLGCGDILPVPDIPQID